MSAPSTAPCSRSSSAGGCDDPCGSSWRRSSSRSASMGGSCERSTRSRSAAVRVTARPWMQHSRRCGPDRSLRSRRREACIPNLAGCSGSAAGSHGWRYPPGPPSCRSGSGGRKRDGLALASTGARRGGHRSRSRSDRRCFLRVTRATNSTSRRSRSGWATGWRNRSRSHARWLAMPELENDPGTEKSRPLGAGSSMKPGPWRGREGWRPAPVAEGDGVCPGVVILPIEASREDVRATPEKVPT